MAGAALACVLATALFAFSYLRYSGGLEDQERQLTKLSARLANVAARQAPTEPLDLNLALDAANETVNASTQIQDSPFMALGPSATAELSQVQSIAYNQTLRNILEPRMVATLEATMWRHSRDPDFLLGALKTYQMMTGLAAYDADFVSVWWQTVLPEFAPIDVFPPEEAIDHQLAAITRMASEEDRITAQPELVQAALESICTIPLAPGAFTFEAFHQLVEPSIPDVAAQAILDRAVFQGGCAESSEASAPSLEADIRKLYYDDYIAQWDGFLRDVRLTPISDLAEARVNLKDLSSEDSALKRLLVEVVRQTHLTRSEEDGGGVDTSKAQKGLFKAATKRLGMLGKIANKSAKLAKPSGGATAVAAKPGDPVAQHFKPIRAVVEEVDGKPPLLSDTVTALTALSNELQTVAASTDPKAALLARGGLPLLTGAIADQAAFLPDPISDWVKGIAGDTIEFTREAIIAQLNARWRADVLTFCTSATRGRYPFDQSSSIDVNIADFARLFGPGGLVDTFTKDHLAAYIDEFQTPWAWRNDIGLDNALLAPLQNARAMQLALFPGGAGPVMAFTLEPKDLSAGASRVILNVDGQSLSYFNAAARPQPMTWPGQDGTNMITLSFAPVDGSPEVITSQTGSWAFLRLIRGGNLQATALPEVFRLTLAAGGHRSVFDLRANSVENPFDLSMFSGFTCPQGF